MNKKTPLTEFSKGGQVNRFGYLKCAVLIRILRPPGILVKSKSLLTPHTDTISITGIWYNRSVKTSYTSSINSRLSSPEAAIALWPKL